jgi:L-threonylcarbamoyladenylate synthase
VSALAVEAAVAALRAGDVVVIPTDTVYGLAASLSEEPVRRLYRLKGREATVPTAIVAVSVEHLLECLPELRGRSATIVRELLPGPYTLVLPNPGRRFPWLCGRDQEAIGVRVPELAGPARRVLEGVGAVAATSANAPGGPDPRRPEDVPEQLRKGASALVEAGELPGIASTVIDFTLEEPRVLRDGAAPGEDAIARVEGALR